MALLPYNAAEAQSFKNCAAVKAKYPNGVAINFRAMGTSGAEINRAVYLRNQRLDRDKDGLICEDESKQNPNSTTATTTTIAPSIGSSGGTSQSRSWLGCYLNGKEMWGRVYVSPYSWDADFKVYVSPYSWSADLKVYNAPYSWSATSCGQWYLTRYSWDADFKVYFTTYSWDANLSIYVTPYSWAAGR